MYNMIMANVKRLMKNTAFRIAAALIAAVGLFEIFMIYKDAKAEMEIAYFDSGLFSFAAVGVFALAAIVPLFVGNEYSDGTIRNKIVVGHHRVSVYLSILITSILMECIFILVWTAAYLLPGVILMEHANPLWVYLYLYLGMFLELAAFTALFTLFTMLLGNKAASAVVCIFAAFLLMMQGIVVKSMLDEPEYYPPQIMIADDGEVTYGGDLEPNPNYIPEGSLKRKVYNFLMDFMPGGQALQISAHTVDNLNKICLYDVCWMIVLSGIGLWVFERKDLK